MNFALEELGKLILLDITKKSKALLLLLSLLFFSSLNSVEVVCASIFHSHLCKHQNSALALSALSLLFHFRYGL
jgi:hypothetical protein